MMENNYLHHLRLAVGKGNKEAYRCLALASAWVSNLGMWGTSFFEGLLELF